MLTTVDVVQAMPGLNNPAIAPIPFLNSLIGAATDAIKIFTKRDLELRAYVEYYDGNNQRDLVLNQWPLLVGQTTIAASSSGATLPTGTINVASTAGFHPGLGGNTDPNATLPYIGVQTGLTTWAVVSYTGTTSTSFTGCLLGTGTLSSVQGLNRVVSPVVFFDPGGYADTAPTGLAPNTGPFSAGTQMVYGTQYMPNIDRGGPAGRKSVRATLKKLGGPGVGFVGTYQENYWSGKLGAYRMPVWPLGDRNVKVIYSAGYNPIPFSLSYACAMLVAYMARNMPKGSPLSNESLGAYSYSALTQSNDVPELGSIQRILASYRESTW